jgi:Dihaem cytochrome c
MTFSFFSPFLMRATTLTAVWLTTLAAPVWADDHGPRVPLLAAYKSECSSCHVAYPVGLLPAASWQRLMTHLPKHFGTDASLDAATTKQVSDWLMANGGGRRAAEAPPEDRITKGRWFIREHDEVAAEVWKRPAIKSAANCAACHTQAAEGSFRERDIRIPK